MKIARLLFLIVLLTILAMPAFSAPRRSVVRRAPGEARAGGAHMQTQGRTPTRQPGAKAAAGGGWYYCYRDPEGTYTTCPSDWTSGECQSECERVCEGPCDWDNYAT